MRLGSTLKGNKRHEGKVKLLSSRKAPRPVDKAQLPERRDVNPNRQDVHGQTTISCALDGGHEGAPILPRKDVVSVGVSHVGEICSR